MKIALVMNDDFSVWRFWRGLISALHERGVEVWVVTPDGPYVAPLIELGARHIPVEMNRFVSVLGDAKMVWRLYRVFRSHGFDMVCNITIKPIVYGSIAARLAGVEHIVGMIEGLGYSFGEAASWRVRLIQAVARRLYRLGCGLCERIGFANPEDLEMFVKLGFVQRRQTVGFRSMIGVPLAEYASVGRDPDQRRQLRGALDIPESCVVIIMVVARVVWSKGVRQFVEASEIARGWSTPTHFLLVGPLDPEAIDAVPQDYLRASASPAFSWLGFRSDVDELLAVADVVTLPSYYREGLPRVLMEGLAMGKPIVTTDNVGCREAVDDGENGFLISTRDAPALASALEKLVADESLRDRFGASSLAKARAEFDEKVIVERIIVDLYAIDHDRD